MLSRVGNAVAPGVAASGIVNVPFDGYDQLLLSYLNETLIRDR
jgi:hypothetical protein